MSCLLRDEYDTLKKALLPIYTERTLQLSLIIHTPKVISLAQTTIKHVYFASINFFYTYLITNITIILMCTAQVIFLQNLSSMR